MIGPFDYLTLRQASIASATSRRFARSLSGDLLKLDNLQVLSHRTVEKNGYTAVQLGAGTRKPSRLTKADRDGVGYDRMIEVKVSWDPDPDAALANTRFWAPLSLSAEQKHSIHSPAEMEKAADELPIEQVAKRWVVASRPEQVIEALRMYTDLGFDHLVVHGPGHDQERFLSTFAEQVMPGLRELVPAQR